MHQNRFDPFRAARILRPDFDGLHARDELWQPSADIVELSDAYLIAMDIPGVVRDDIDISVEQRVLTVSGQRPRPELSDDARIARRERSCGRFERRFRLPESIDADGIEARARDGVLELRIPKAAALKARKIEVVAA